MTPFHPKATSTVSISATTASSNVALAKVPTGSFQVRVHNAGASTAFIARGTDSTVAATVPSGATPGSMPVPAGAVEVLTFNSPDAAPITHVAAITAGGAATIYFTVGEGI